MFLSNLFKYSHKKHFNKNVIMKMFQIQKISYSSETNVVKSKVGDIKIPDILLEEYLWNKLDKWHDRTAVVCAETGRNYNYSELYRKSIALANFLHNFPKLKQNDTIAVILPNVPEYPIISIGVIQAGLRVTTVNPIYTFDEIRNQLVASETKLVFTLNEYWPKINQAIKTLPDVPIVVVNHQQNQPVPSGAIRFDEICQGENKLSFKITKNTNDVISLPYSSGTTGLPKGVELTNKNIVSNLHQMTAHPFKVHKDTEGSYQEVIPSVLPLFHLYGYVLGMFNMLASGCKLVTLPTFRPELFLKLLKEYHPTFAYLVPPLVLFLLNEPKVLPEYISHIHTIMCGAAPLGTADIERLTKKINGKVNLLQAYGLTETSPATHIQTKYFDGGNKIGGIGYVIPNTECKVVALDDDTKTGLGCNQSGEMLIRGPQVMKGYYKNPKATTETIDSNGWLRTGDLAYYDEDEQFFITDRLKELIKVKGYQVAPAELEELLRDHPDIEDAAVVGIPNADFGEIPKAFIVLKKNAKFNDRKIQEYMKTKAAKYKQLLGGIVVTGSIPRSLSGKILRRHLKEL